MRVTQWRYRDFEALVYGAEGEPVGRVPIPGCLSPHHCVEAVQYALGLLSEDYPRERLYAEVRWVDYPDREPVRVDLPDQ
jgi:hypothetical protein